MKRRPKPEPTKSSRRRKTKKKRSWDSLVGLLPDQKKEKQFRDWLLTSLGKTPRFAIEVLGSLLVLSTLRRLVESGKIDEDTFNKIVEALGIEIYDIPDHDD